MRRKIRFGVASGNTLKYCQQCENDDHHKFHIKQMDKTRCKYPNDNPLSPRTLVRPIFCCSSCTGRCGMCSLHPLSKSKPKSKGRNKNPFDAKKMISSDSRI